MPSSSSAGSAARYTEREGARLMRQWAAEAERDLAKGRREAARGSGGGRGRSYHARVGRAPRSASQFRYEKKYSSRTGGRRGKSPTSAVSKILYDFDTAQRGDDRVTYRYVAFRPGTPRGALDPLKVARHAEATAGRQASCRIMGHDGVALPRQLSEAARHELAARIADEISATMGTTVFAAVHSAPSETGNYHVHTSYPIREIIPDANAEDGFRLGDRIPWEQRPAWRAAHGLASTTHEELQALRGRVAGLCADALKAENADFMLVERWRHGAKRLNTGDDTQVMAARARGDWEFVQENALREVQRHEGPGLRRAGDTTPAQQRNAELSAVSPAILAENVMRGVLDDAQKAGVQDWEALRALAAERGLTVIYNRQRSGKTAGQVSGLTYEIGGLRVPGKAAGGLSLGGVRKALKTRGFAFADQPPAYAPPPRAADPVAARQARGQALAQVLAEARDQGKGGAKPPAQPRSAAAKTVSPSGKQGLRQEKDMDLKSMMAEITRLPDEPTEAPVDKQKLLRAAVAKSQEIARRQAENRARKEAQDAATQAREAARSLSEGDKDWLLLHSPCLPHLQEMQQKISRLEQQAKLLEASPPEPQIGWLKKRENPAFPAWEQRLAAVRDLLLQRRKAAGVALQSVYENPALQVQLREARAAEAEAHEKSVLTAYQRAEVMRGTPGYESEAKRLHHRLERENPDLIAAYKARQEKDRLAAAAERARAVPDELELDDGDGRSSGRRRGGLRPTGAGEAYQRQRPRG